MKADLLRATFFPLGQCKWKETEARDRDGEIKTRLDGNRKRGLEVLLQRQQETINQESSEL